MKKKSLSGLQEYAYSGYYFSFNLTGIYLTHRRKSLEAESPELTDSDIQWYQHP